MVDKRTRRVIRPTKIVVLKELTSLGIRVQQIIAGNSYAMWRVLLPSPEDAVALTKTPLENKDHIFKVEYMGRRRTMVTLHEVPEYYGVKNLTAHMMDYGDVVAVHPDSYLGEWKFELMLDFKTFHSIPNWLDVNGERIPMIISGRKPACWRCSQVGHLSAACPGKKDPKKHPVTTQDSLPPNKATVRKEAPVVSPAVGTQNPLGVGVQVEAPPPSESKSLTTTKKAEGEWLTVGKGGRKVQPAGPQLLMATQSAPSSGETPRSYARTTTTGICTSPGKEKFEKLLKWKAEFDAQRKRPQQQLQGVLDPPRLPLNQEL